MFRRSLSVLASVALIWAMLFATPAGAAVVFLPEDLTIEGQPTPEEISEILYQWQRLGDAFPAADGCIEPLTVVVEPSNAWGGSTAAYYKPSQDTVYVKHGKVRDEHLIHEMAHHLDFSCGFGSGERGFEFLSAQGFAPDHEWARGSGWRDVPAEHFAEAVVGYLGIDSVDLPVTDRSYRILREFANGWGANHSPAPVGPENPI